VPDAAPVWDLSGTGSPVGPGDLSTRADGVVVPVVGGAPGLTLSWALRRIGLPAASVIALEVWP
jgi:hypothetical protein